MTLLLDVRYYAQTDTKRRTRNSKLIGEVTKMLTNAAVQPTLPNVSMSTQEVPIVAFLREVMRRQKRLPSQLAGALGISHTTVSRWLSGEDVPSTRSCGKLAKYSGTSLQKILSIAGHLPMIMEQKPLYWPEFREYAQHKYPKELDEDLITMIEDLIERRRRRRYDSGGRKSS